MQNRTILIQNDEHNLMKLRNTIQNSGLFIAMSFLGILISCNTYKNLPKGESNITFNSVYENDTISVKVNDTTRFKNHKIDMIFEWGISKNTSIYVKGNKFRIVGSFSTTYVVDIEPPAKIKRKLEFDTTLKAKNGRYIDFFARHNELVIEQHKNVRIVE